MFSSTPITSFQFRTALARIHRETSAEMLEASRRLVVRALRQGGAAVSSHDDLVSEVVGSLLARLLEIRARAPQRWQTLLSLPEASLRATLRKMARNAAMDLDPARAEMRALAQLIGRVLETPLSSAPVAPLSLRVRGRLGRTEVSSAVAWALAQPDAPPRKPYRLAHYLLARYGGTLRLEECTLPMGAPDPEREFERSEHAARVAEELLLRLEPDEVEALSLHLGGATVDAIAHELGCGRTKAHGLAARARDEAVGVVVELAQEWETA